MVLNYVQHIFPGRAKIFPGGFAHSAPPWLRAWSNVVQNCRQITQ